MTHLKAGDKAPPFHLQDQNRNGWTLSDFDDHWLVLYFYPKDDTPGCTKEACAFKDARDRYEEAEVKVVGVSPDTHDSHSRFVDKYDLPFTLLADELHQAAEDYGVWQEGSNSVRRETFLIDPHGTIRKVYENVDPESHANQVLSDIETLKAKATS